MKKTIKILTFLLIILSYSVVANLTAPNIIYPTAQLFAEEDYISLVWNTSSSYIEGTYNASIEIDNGSGYEVVADGRIAKYKRTMISGGQALDSIARLIEVRNNYVWRYDIDLTGGGCDGQNALMRNIIGSSSSTNVCVVKGNPYGLAVDSEFVYMLNSTPATYIVRINASSIGQVFDTLPLINAPSIGLNNLKDMLDVSENYLWIGNSILYAFNKTTGVFQPDLNLTLPSSILSGDIQWIGEFTGNITNTPYRFVDSSSNIYARSNDQWYRTSTTIDFGTCNGRTKISQTFSPYGITHGTTNQGCSHEWELTGTAPHVTKKSQGNYSWRVKVYNDTETSAYSVGHFNVEGIDTTPPTVTIQYPPNMYYVDGTTFFPLKVNGTALDDNLSSIWTSDSRFTNQGSVNVFDFRNNTFLADGSYNITVFANDTSGNVGSDSITVYYLDTVNPLINLQANNSFLPDNSSVFENGTAQIIFSFTGYDEFLNNVSAQISIGGNITYSVDEDNPPVPTYYHSKVINTTMWTDGTYEVNIEALNHIHNSTRNFQFAICTPSWSCLNYGECETTDEKTCNETIDLNTCGLTYTSDYSEFTKLTCNYCTSTWSTTTSECITHNQTTTYEYTNTCCADTGLPTDCNIPPNTTSGCSLFEYGEDTAISTSLLDTLIKLIIGIGSWIPVTA